MNGGLTVFKVFDFMFASLLFRLVNPAGLVGVWFSDSLGFSAIIGSSGMMFAGLDCRLMGFACLTLASI